MGLNDEGREQPEWVDGENAEESEVNFLPKEVNYEQKVNLIKAQLAQYYFQSLSEQGVGEPCLYSHQDSKRLSTAYKRIQQSRKNKINHSLLLEAGLGIMAVGETPHFQFEQALEELWVGGTEKKLDRVVIKASKVFIPRAASLLPNSFAQGILLSVRKFLGEYLVDADLFVNRFSRGQVDMLSDINNLIYYKATPLPTRPEKIKLTEIYEAARKSNLPVLGNGFVPDFGKTLATESETTTLKAYQTHVACMKGALEAIRICGYFDQEKLQGTLLQNYLVTLREIGDLRLAQALAEESAGLIARLIR